MAGIRTLCSYDISFISLTETSDPAQLRVAQKARRGYLRNCLLPFLLYVDIFKCVTCDVLH